HRPAPARQAAGLRGRRLHLVSSPSPAALRLAPPRFARQCLTRRRVRSAVHWPAGPGPTEPPLSTPLPWSTPLALRQRRARTDVGQRPAQARAVGRADDAGRAL